MLTLLHGQDTFRSRAALQEIIASRRNSAKTGLDVKILDAKELSMETLAQELAAVSMFQESKLFVFARAFGEKRVKEFFQLHKNLLLQTPHDIVFFEEEEVLSKDTLFQLVAKNGNAQKFAFLSGISLDRWIMEEGGRHGIDISKEALKELSSSHGGDLWALSQELRKLAAFKQSESSKKVSTQDVRALSSRASFETDIFATIDAIAQQNKSKALELAHRHLAKGDAPLYLFSMIHSQFRNLLQAKDYKGGSIAMHPFVFKKSRELASLFSMEELREVYEKIWQSDIAIKTGAIEGEAALDAFLLGA